MPPRILVNEDSAIDFTLLEAEFRRASFVYEARRVETRTEFVRALTEFVPNLVLSDYYLPGFTGLDALAIVRAQAPTTPFIILTNALNEEIAVECMKRGATDYVLKNRLPRLVAILRSTLEQQRLLREKDRIEREHEQLFQLTPDLFCLAALDGTLQVVNPAWTARLGFAKDEIIGRLLETVVHPEDRQGLATWWASLITRGQEDSRSPLPSDFECRFVHKQGGFRHILWSGTPFLQENKIYAYGHDITERKRAESALRESELRFRTMADSAPVLIWVCDTAKAFFYFNRPWLEFTGRRLEQEIGRGWTAGIHIDDIERCLQIYDENFDARRPFRMEYRLRRHDGQYRWIVDNGSPRYDDHGTFSGFIGSCIDIHDQHEAETRLAIRALKQAALASFGRFALAQHPFSALIQEATRLVSDTLRVDRSQVLSLHAASGEVIHAAGTGLPGESLGVSWGPIPTGHLIEGHPLLIDEPGFPAAAIYKNLGAAAGLAVPVGTGKRAYGYLTAVSQQARVFSREAVDFLQGIANILSTVHQRERAEAALEESEQKLLQSQKMEAVGLLAGGVAHDFNNLLTAIRCYGDLLNDDLAELAPSAQPKVAEILKATSRASALTRQLLAFSRKQILQPEFLDLNNVVAELKDLIRSLLSENVELSFNPAAEIATIEADRSQIEQVLINLSINARDAMASGGRLTLEVGFRDVRDGEFPELLPGSYVDLSVSDTGIGMTEDVQAHLFQPFFTTKPKGRGTGLGLATCAVIIKHYQGAIHFRSQIGHGTTFHVLLPHLAMPEFNRSLDLDAEPVRGTERILIAEDDEAIRQVTGNIVQSLGYRVQTVPGGAEALALCAGENAPFFDLLLTDIVMPFMGGRELAERLSALRPGLRVLFMSGYVDDPEIQQAVEDSQVPFLEKPFTRASLAKKIREALENGQERR